MEDECMNLVMFMSPLNLCAIVEFKYQSSVIANRNRINNRQPKAIIKFGEQFVTL